MIAYNNRTVLLLHTIYFTHFVLFLFVYSGKSINFASKRSVMTQLTNEEHQKQMADMKGFDEQMPILDELTTLIEEEFSLPYFEFVYDEH